MVSKLFTLRESRRPTWILRHFKTCRHLLFFLASCYGWLFAAGCLLLSGCWALLVAPNCNVCEIIYLLEKWSQINTKSLQNWSQNYPKIIPKWHQKWPQNQTKWGPKSSLWGFWAHFWRPWLASPLFCHLLMPFWGPFWRYFKVKKLEKTIRSLLIKYNAKKNGNYTNK